MALARIAAYDREIARMGAIKAERGEVITGLCASVCALWSELEFAPADATEEAIAARGAGLACTLESIGALREKLAGLEAEKAAREEKICELGHAITSLWKRLATPEEEQTAFLEAHAGIGDGVIAACEE
jgi:hypothetical protein